MPFYTMQDDEKLYVREIGQGEPVLVLSGLGMQSWQWIPFFAFNLKKYKFIIPDWRGFGGSKHCKIPDTDAISSHWNDIQALISQRPRQQYRVIAYSMGATTAMHGMQYGQFADQIQAYLHIDQTPKIPSDETWSFGLLGDRYPEFKKLLIELSSFLHQHENYQNLSELPTHLSRELVELWVKFLSLQDNHQLSAKIFKTTLNQPKIQKLILPMQRLDYMRWYIDNYLNHKEDYRAAISKLECPATFFIGAKSALYPAQGQKLIAESVKNHRIVLFERSGHTPLINEPIKFSQEISKFLNQTI